MSWNKNCDPRPFGVPLDDIAAALAGTNFQTTREGDSLLIKDSNLSTRIDVIRPANRETEDRQIQAVVQVRTTLPQEASSILATPKANSAMNALATLGALTTENGTMFVGSRLTTYEGEQAWNIQFPLILSAIASADPMLGAMRGRFTAQAGENTESAWVEPDFERVRSYLSRLCVCTTGGLGLTAEFGLRESAVSAIAGDRHTALWELRGDRPHPDAGGGLFCLLQMPHQVSDQARLDHVLMQLNRMEMAPDDLPPHFGAWRSGKIGNNPAYISFLPNLLHATAGAGIAVNMSIWALNRAQWADAMLASMDIR